MELKEKITNREATVAVIGLGYVGLPLAVEIAKVGFSVAGVDISPEKVKLVNDGRSDIRDVPDEVLSPLVMDGKLRATTEFSILKQADVISICVPSQ